MAHKRVSYEFPKFQIKRHLIEDKAAADQLEAFARDVRQQIN